MNRAGLSICLVLATSIVWLACSDTMTNPSDMTGDSRQTSSTSNPASNPTTGTVDLANFTCDSFEEVRVRFSDPGYIRSNEVGLYAAFMGGPPGDKFLRIWWDHDNAPTASQIVDTQEGEVRRDNDQLFDVEALVEHTYSGLSGPTERNVRVELIAEEGNTRLCGRNRRITVAPPPSTGPPTGPPSITCDAATEVAFGGRCYYLDGSGGTCDAGYELAPQSVLSSIAGSFVGKTYKNSISNNCCITNSDPDQDWGMIVGVCNAPGPFAVGPVLGANGCTDQMIMLSNQLTFCRTD